jgi:cytochrome P450
MKNKANANRPAHIPDAAFYDFDIFHDVALLEDPHKRARELLHDAPPVFWTPHNGGHWIATRYEDAHTVLRTHETFSSTLISPDQQQAMMAAMPPHMPRFPQLTPIMLDPPDHTKFRLPLQRAFAPKTIIALKTEIVALAHQLIDDVIDQGACDFISAVAEQLPVRVFLQMMGLPSERLAEFRVLAREAFAPKEFDYMVYSMHMRKMADAMMGEILARRDEPKSDLISMLWSLNIDGEPMTLELMEDYAVLLFLAGLDTVVNAIAFGMHHLARNPDLQNTLRANPALIPDATEELLRSYTFTIPVRRVKHDTQFGGWTLKADERIMLYCPAADLDEREFSAPEVFDLARENKVHMAFGAGPHRCLGSHLARMELHILYSVVLERLPTFRLDPEQPIQFHAGQNLSMTALPLRWD